MRLGAIAAKLQFGQGLEPGDPDAILAGNLLHMIVLNEDPRPLLHESVGHAPNNAEELDIALHYRLLALDGRGTIKAALSVAEAWQYEDATSVQRIERKRRKECDDILKTANQDARSAWLKDILRRVKARTHQPS